MNHLKFQKAHVKLHLKRQKGYGLVNINYLKSINKRKKTLMLKTSFAIVIKL